MFCFLNPKITKTSANVPKYSPTTIQGILLYAKVLNKNGSNKICRQLNSAVYYIPVKSTTYEIFQKFLICGVAIK